LAHLLGEWPIQFEDVPANSFPNCLWYVFAIPFAEKKRGCVGPADVMLLTIVTSFLGSPSNSVLPLSVPLGTTVLRGCWHIGQKNSFV
jgi:hypothetical protein